VSIDSAQPHRIAAGWSGMLVPRQTARFDENGDFIGHEPRGCGEHHTAGAYRAWCVDCKEWCHPDVGCIRCAYPSYV
jgi:hypothetical protein